MRAEGSEVTHHRGCCRTADTAVARRSGGKIRIGNAEQTSHVGEGEGLFDPQGARRSGAVIGVFGRQQDGAYVRMVPVRGADQGFGLTARNLVSDDDGLHRMLAEEAGRGGRGTRRVDREPACEVLGQRPQGERVGLQHEEARAVGRRPLSGRRLRTSVGAIGVRQCGTPVRKTDMHSACQLIRGPIRCAEARSAPQPAVDERHAVQMPAGNAADAATVARS